MVDPYSDFPELSAEAQAIARRRKIAEAMMQRGQAPLESMGMAGGAPIPISWTQGLAQLANAYVGGEQMRDTETADKALADKYTGMETDAVSKVRDAMLGTPGKQAPFQADNPFGEDLGANTTVTPAVAPGGRDAVQAALLESKMPGFRTAGQQMMLKSTEQQGQMQQIQDILKGAQVPGAPVPQGSTVDFRGNVPQAVSEVNRISDPAIRADAQAAVASQGAPVVLQTPAFKSGGLTEEQAIALSSISGNPAAMTLGKTALAGIEKQRSEYNRAQDRKEGRQDTFANQNFMQQQAIAATNERAALDRQSRIDTMREKAEALKSNRSISNVDARSIDKSIATSSGANSALQLLDEADALYGKYSSGRAEPILGPVGRIGAAVGIGDESKVTDYETAGRIAKDLGVIKLGLIGGSDTERELQVAIDTSPSPDKLPATNKIIIANQRRAIEILQAEPDFKTEWVNKYGSLSRLGDNGEPYGKAWRKYQKDNFKPVMTASGGAPGGVDRRAPNSRTVTREVKLKDGRTGVEYSDGTRGYK